MALLCNVVRRYNLLGITKSLPNDTRNRESIREVTPKTNINVSIARRDDLSKQCIVTKVWLVGLFFKIFGEQKNLKQIVYDR